MAEIHLSKISLNFDYHVLKAQLASILHNPPFSLLSPTPLNFELYVFPRRQRASYRAGAFTLPTAEAGVEFLKHYGGPSPGATVMVGASRIWFERSNRGPRSDVLDRIRMTPFVEIQVQKRRESLALEVQEKNVSISRIQFGWECRDNVYSIEHEVDCENRTAVLTFDDERREFRVKLSSYAGLFSSQLWIIAIRVAEIYWTSITPGDTRPVIFLSLKNPPAFEFEPENALITGMLPGAPPARKRRSSFTEEHLQVAPYTSLALRLECRRSSDVPTFRWFAKLAQIRPDDYRYPVERRGLFDLPARQAYLAWASNLPWAVAFQVEALIRGHQLDFMEVLTLRLPLQRCLEVNGVDYTASLLRDFASQVKDLYWYGDARQDHSGSIPSIAAVFRSTRNDFVYMPPRADMGATDTSVFNCLHVNVTPTTMYLEGPFPERSNRVMRTYYQHQDSFLRVSFADETRLQFRFDREVDGREFVDRRVKTILLHGLRIAGRHFEFLAYSQSALKEHAVWFVKPFNFTNSDGSVSLVTAASIISSLGSFRDLAYDPTLIRCPARYAARISQAFTATDVSVSVEVDQVRGLPDITVPHPRGKWMFTDGVGTISPQLAKEIWQALQARRRRGRRDRTYPRAFQVRFMGSKGMLSVDYTLTGRVICLRPSMIKFDAPNSVNVEIARAFDKPGVYYLNRPLIMLLEGLGVQYDVFKRLQDSAVQEVQRSVESLERSARLLETHGLGTSFRLTSSMLGLHKLGLEPPDHDIFWRQMMEFAIHHALRELKHHARIPVPDSWTLVGVADVHGYLQEGQIFACIDAPGRGGLIYLQGRTLISRSPTIHPGDAQVVHAIGRPPPGSPFERESLRNTVVFSIKGARDLPSCLGGGDLDGDVYNVTTIPDMLPKRTFQPSEYTAAPRKLVDHDSTMADVAEFVAEYINSDTLGMIAIHWLITADFSEEGILHPNCLQLAALHSDAVDYPKSGNPVPLERIPRLLTKLKPDWNAPETRHIREGDSKYYESQRAIGRLYRAIDLPALGKVERAARFQRRHIRDDGDDTEAFEELMERFLRDDSDDEGEGSDVFLTVEEHVSRFASVREFEPETIKELWELYRSYVARLRAICADHTLSNDRSAMLTEEEAIVGTIVAKCSQPRKRKDLMSKMRESAAILVGNIREQISGDDEMHLEDALSRAWTAYRIAYVEEAYFGARSFAWIALGEIFDTIKDIEQEERTTSRR